MTVPSRRKRWHGIPPVACTLLCIVCCGKRQQPETHEAGTGDADSSPSGDAGASSLEDVAEAGPWPHEDAPSVETSTSRDATVSSDLPDSATSLVDAVDATDVEADAVTDEEVSASPSDADVTSVDGGPSDVSGPCGAIVEQRAIEGFVHVPVCSHVHYQTKPPSSGNHYPIWASYKSYASAIPEGFWVHNLEHGAVVVSYNCPSGCARDVLAAQAWMDGLPDDPACDPSAGQARVRILMTPDPNLDVTFAASAWGWTLRANCFDPVTFSAFVQAHYSNGREAICYQGQDLSLGVQDGCGE